MPGATGRITLHSSWRGILSAFVSGLLVGGIGGWAAVASDFRIVPTLIALAGLGIVLVALLDYPVATTFDLEGAHRRMVLRRQTIRWDKVRQLTRTRPALVRGARPL
nr:hypothetical protein [Ilumatobacteraceae bacterium]